MPSTFMDKLGPIFTPLQFREFSPEGEAGLSNIKVQVCSDTIMDVCVRGVQIYNMLCKKSWGVFIDLGCILLLHFCGHLFGYVCCCRLPDHSIESRNAFLRWFRTIFWSNWNLKRTMLNFSKCMEYFPLKLTHLNISFFYIFFYRYWLVSYLYSIDFNKHAAQTTDYNRYRSQICEKGGEPTAESNEWTFANYSPQQFAYKTCILTCTFWKARKWSKYSWCLSAQKTPSTIGSFRLPKSS